ncbi:MAG: hypothetical protein CR997_00325 [Acidobacteria bacterium]|nr:MAG: hypothetical protein CR997_00325 [Acidobacteriota bacterium]
MEFKGKNILVVRLSALGDVIRTTPTILGLKKAYPDSRITWLVEDSSAGLFPALEDIPLIILSRKKLKSRNPLVVLAEISRIVKLIRAQHFDLCLDFHGILKSALIPYVARIPIRIGFLPKGSKEHAHFFYTHRVPLENHQISRYLRNLKLLEPYDPSIQLESVSLSLSDETHQWIADMMKENPLLLIPGTSMFGRNKQWPAESWAMLYKNLIERFPVKFVFGPADDHYRESLSRLLNGDPPALPPLSIPELGQALTHSRLVVVCDTGPMHLGSILRVPLLALMGPSDPVLAQPLLDKNAHPRSSIFVPDVPCAPCRNRSCKELICQTFTKPKDVFDRIVLACGDTG